LKRYCPIISGHTIGYNPLICDMKIDISDHTVKDEGMVKIENIQHVFLIVSKRIILSTFELY
jgi:hypothetical protein